MRRIEPVLGARWLVAAAGVLLVGCLGGTGATTRSSPRRQGLGEGTFEEVARFGDNPGNLTMYRYVPPEVAEPAALVVALPGCFSDVRRAIREVGWEDLADRHRFLLLYPEPRVGARPGTCFNWAGKGEDPPLGTRDESNLVRGEGENQSIIEMIDRTAADFALDPARVFVVGADAGGAQAILMLATRPERFAAGAALGGAPYRCTTAKAQILDCASGRVGRSPAEWGDLVREAAPPPEGPYPSLTLWYGTRDEQLDTASAVRELVEQWTDVHGLDLEPDRVSTLDGALVRDFLDDAGVARVSTVEVADVPTRWFVRPDVGCGAVVESASVEAGICAACRIAERFEIGRCPGPDTPDADASLPDTGIDAGADGSLPDAGPLPDAAPLPDPPGDGDVDDTIVRRRASCACRAAPPRRPGRVLSAIARVVGM